MSRNSHLSPPDRAQGVGRIKTTPLLSVAMPCVPPYPHRVQNRKGTNGTAVHLPVAMPRIPTACRVTTLTGVWANQQRLSSRRGPSTTLSAILWTVVLPFSAARALFSAPAAVLSFTLSRISAASYRDRAKQDYAKNANWSSV
jgi:hypothetical protein